MIDKTYAVWKFPLDACDHQVLVMPEGAKLLCVQTQFGCPCIWALVWCEAPKVSRRIIIHGTGHPVEPTTTEHDYVGTFQLSGGSLIFHVFDGGEVSA